MVTATATFPTVNETAIQHLVASMRGEVIRRGDPSYDEVRKVYNGMIDRHPALIARCVDVADVIAAVNFARDHDVLVSVRGGGHHGAGYSVCDDGLVIDLSTLRGVHVDPAARTVRAGGGCTLGEVDHAERDLLDDRGRWHHAWRWGRSLYAYLWIGTRQPA
jgi:FAD/FMN-containing dehydrogenase